MNKILMALTGMLLIFACNKESHLTDPSARLRSSLQDSLPGDSTDSTGHDSIPQYPTDSVFQTINGLVITPSSQADSIIELHIETSTNYPVADSRVEAHFTGSSLDSLNVNVYGIQAMYPYTPGSAPAKTDIWKQWNPGVNVPLSVNLNGTVYTGSISITGLNYTISWAHDSLILISPKTFPR